MPIYVHCVVHAYDNSGPLYVYKLVLINTMFYLVSSILLHTTNIGYTMPVDNNEQQELENRGREDGLAEWDRMFFATNFNCDSNNEYELFLI